MQKDVEIGPNDTLGTVYFDKLFPLGVEAMVESVRLVKAGEAPRIEQDHSQMTYESWCRADDAIVNWSKSVEEIYNLVRGCDPSPGANGTFSGERIKFFSASRDSASAGGAPGEVAKIDETGILVNCRNGAIRIGRVQASGRKKQSASEWAEDFGISPGDRFESTRSD